MAATLDEVYDDLIDAAGFEESGSLVDARKFVTAAKRYLIMSPQSQSDQSSSLTMSVPQIESLLRRAQQYISEQTRVSSGGVRFLTASQGFRR